MTSLDIRGAEMLATPVGRSARRGPEQGEILRIRQPAVRAEDGVLVFVGTEADYRREYGNRPADVTVDATGRTLLPGLVDAHTHPVWVGDRGEEIGRRLAGESYSAIARVRRRDPRHRSRHAGGYRRGARFRRAPPAPQDARARHDDGRGQVGLRPDRCRRAPIAANPRGPRRTRAAADRSDASRGPRSPTGVPRPAGGVGAHRGGRARPAGGPGKARPVLRRLLRGRRLHGGRVAAHPPGGGPGRPGSPHSRRRADALRRRSPGGGARGGLRGPPPLRRATRRSRRSPDRARSRSSCPGRPGGCARGALPRAP